MLISKNIYTNQELNSFNLFDSNQVQSAISLSQNTFLTWKNESTQSKEKLLMRFAELLVNQKRELANLITTEVGTPIKQAEAEIEKCALMCQIYEGKIDTCLCDIQVNQNSYIKHEPLGVVLSIAPWNFPFWMVLRFIIPTIMAGNAVVFKHASNVPACAAKIQELFLQAGFPAGLVTWLPIAASQVEEVLANPQVIGVNFSGGKSAGSQVASYAGKYIKKSVLELGGSDAAIVFADVNVQQVAAELVKARLRNAGQACNSPKRILVHESIYQEFINFAKQSINAYKVADPFLDSTLLGPCISEMAVQTAVGQINTSLSLGAHLDTELSFNANILQPVLITNIQPGMPVFDQEVFAPVVAVGKFTSEQQAVELANDSEYGLGASVWTHDSSLASSLIGNLQAGNVFINSTVRSDPSLPFGGIKNSGYGKELGTYGLLEFTNIKVVFTA